MVITRISPIEFAMAIFEVDPIVALVILALLAII